MKIDTLILGYLNNNCYIITIDNKCLIIDPACYGENIIEKINNKELLGILITHRHSDHIGALDYIIKKTNTKVFDLKLGLHNIGPFNFYVIDTPGHTSDSKTYYFEKDKIMFTGDFIFKDTIGRTDLDDGNMSDMIKSLRMIKKYNDCVIYPGHGEKTTLNYEKENNEFFNL